MKRLFRTSKTAVIDPLPPPGTPPPPSASGASTPRQINPSISSITLNGNGSRERSSSPSHHEHRWFHGRHNEVTPFPSDVGREAPPPPVPEAGRKGKERERGNAAPSLMEIQAMQEQQKEKERRSQPPLSQRQPLPPPPTNASAPDAWPTASPIGIPSQPSTGYDPPYGTPQPLPIPNPSYHSAASPSSTSPSSAGTQTLLYLPPGARPPSPSIRRPSYASAPRHSQSSLSSVAAPYGGSSVDGEYLGRERGQSVASATGSVSARSDHEVMGGSVHGHGSGTTLPPQHQHQHQQSNKLSRPPSSLNASRSPLSNPYIPSDNSPTPTVPAPHPFAQVPSAISPAEPLPNPFPQADDMPSGQLNLHNLPPRGAESEQTREGGKEKEKKRFWGMGWGDKKSKGRDKERDRDGGEYLSRPSVDESRRSVDGWKDSENQSQSTSAHGHEQEEAPRGRLLGLDFGGGKRDVGQVNDVTSAIRMLCATSDPSPANVYEVCDRINHSDATDSISKEAARALRKEFKHGNDSERRNAAKVWLLLMRNVSIKGFRAHACNKKFLTGLEPLLLAPPSKPVLAPATLGLITDVVADLTYSYSMEKGCEGLTELWKKVKLPQEPDFGRPLAADHPIFNPDPILPPHMQQSSPFPTPSNSVPISRQSSSPSLQQHSLIPGYPPGTNQRSASPNHFGPAYASLPNHNDDLRRLMDECTAAKESARVLSEALVYTRPDELELKPVIGEFYRKVFHAHESLTNQMDWAQAEASRSRERHASLTLAGPTDPEIAHESTVEEKALAMLFEAHSALAEALKQHDDLDRMAMDEREMREVSERSKKEMRMDRNQHATIDANGGFLAPNKQNQASSSRSPSPAPNARLPREPSPKLTASPRHVEMPLPTTTGTAPFQGGFVADRSRTPSPDRHLLPQPPKLSASPGRANSPLGRSKMGPRPLPDPFKGSRSASQASFANALGSPQGPGSATSHSNGPSRSGTGETGRTGSVSAVTGVPEDEIDGDDLPPVPLKPSRKALGKRRAVVDEDNTFDPNDMFNPVPNPRSTAPTNNDRDRDNDKDNDNDSDESLTADAVWNAKPPVVYAYDAYEERQRELRAAALARASGAVGGSGSGGI